MYRLKNIKQNILIAAFATFLVGCGGGGTTGTTDTTATSNVVEVQSKASIVTENSATIEWIENDYTTELLEYGTSENYGSELLIQEESTINYKKSGSEFVVESVVTLSELEADTIYNYRIVGKKNGEKVVSSNKTFRTSEPTPEPIVTEPAPTEPIVTEPIVTEPVPTEPVPTEPIVTEPIVTEPVPTEPTEPIVTEPVPTEPIVTEPVPTEPIVTEPVPTEPIVTEPVPTEPIVTEPAPTEPIVTEPAPTEPIVTEPVPTPVCISGPAIQQGQVKDSISGTGLVDVTVTIAGCSTKTDANGFYTLNNIVVNDKAVVNFEKEGYVLSSIQIQIKTLSGDNTPSSNYLEYTLYTYDNQSSYDSQVEATSPQLYIPSSVYTDASGTLYEGSVTTGLKILDIATKEGKELFPGSFEGKDSNGVNVKFDSYGLISILPRDDEGNKLTFIDGKTATLAFDGVASLYDQIVPMWYYDYDQGTWIQEGYAERQEGGWYQGTIPHPGTWSLSKPIEDAPGIYRGRIVYEDGTPAKDIRVHAVGDMWMSTDLSTDEDGIFEIEVVPGKSFQLKAYNYKDKYEAIYDSIIPAIASGEILENRI